ncbi:MAG: alanine racemase [Eubacteriales bacterium]|nr:alanine racemase [Eubacteriales bacterium]
MNNTIAEISLGAIAHNIDYVRKTLPPTTGIMAVVKANAYGHGAIQVAEAALNAGAVYLAVAQPDEGVFLRQNGIIAPILILGGVLPQQIHMALAYDLILTVYTPEMVHDVARVCREDLCRALVHLKVETGMNRIGAMPGEALEDVLDAVQDCPEIVVDGMFSHLSVADDLQEDTYTGRQIALFAQAAEQVRARGLRPKCHLGNSAAALRGLETQLDMIRLGIAMYGLEPDGSEPVGLVPAMSWKTHVTHVKWLEAGESIGYGRTTRTQRRSLIATIPVGYADGYRRSFGHKGYVLIRGKRAPIVGNVCMDQCMVDVTDIGEVLYGEEAVLMGKQGGEEISAALLAQWADTIHYEIITCVGMRVPRIYRL